VDEDFFETYGYPPCYENGRMYDMPEITIEQVYREIQQLKTVLLGVPGTDDMGLYGQVKDMVKLQKEINGTVRSTGSWTPCFSFNWKCNRRTARTLVIPLRTYRMDFKPFYIRL